MASGVFRGGSREGAVSLAVRQHRLPRGDRRRRPMRCRSKSTIPSGALAELVVHCKCWLAGAGAGRQPEPAQGQVRGAGAGCGCLRCEFASRCISTDCSSRPSDRRRIETTKQPIASSRAAPGAAGRACGCRCRAGPALGATGRDGGQLLPPGRPAGARLQLGRRRRRGGSIGARSSVDTGLYCTNKQPLSPSPSPSPRRAR